MTLVSVRKLGNDLRERLTLEGLSINGWGMTIFNHDRFRRCSLWEMGKHTVLGGANGPLL